MNQTYGSLAGRTAIVTGAAGGIGLATVQLFVEQGARVALLDIDREGLSRAIEHVGSMAHRVIAVPTDVTDEASVADAMARVQAVLGTATILVNVAGGSSAKDAPVDEVDMELWDRTMSLDLKGTFLCCRHAIPAMVKVGRGDIVNISSWSALRSFRKHIYVAAKGGVLSLTRSIAGEYARQGLRANAICPGGVRSERNKQRYETLAPDDPVAIERKDRLARYPHFEGEPAEIASIVLFLASDASRMISGATIPADGGYSCF